MRKLGALLIVAILSGCSGNGGSRPPAATEETGTPTSTGTLEVQSNLPEWNLGQGWTYRVERPGLATETFKMVVAEDRDDLWIVASNNRTQAVNHAVYSTNPMMGRIGKETLSPYQSGAPAKMYQFPLTDGKTWQGTFFGQTMNFQAVYVGDIDTTQIATQRNLPKRIDGFRITASGGGNTVTYDYVEAVEWFTAFELRSADGNRELRLSISDFEGSYTGQYFFYRGAPDSDSVIKEGRHESTTIPPTTSETLDANVPGGFKDFVGLGVIYVGKSSTPPPRLDVWLRNPGGATAFSQSILSSREFHLLQDLPGIDGRWTLQLNMTGTLTYEARLFGISKYAEGSI